MDNTWQLLLYYFSLSSASFCFTVNRTRGNWSLTNFYATSLRNLISLLCIQLSLNNTTLQLSLQLLLLHIGKGNVVFVKSLFFPLSVQGMKTEFIQTFLFTDHSVLSLRASIPSSISSPCCEGNSLLHLYPNFFRGYGSSACKMPFLLSWFKWH